MHLALAALIIGMYLWFSTRGAKASLTGDHTTTKAPSVPVSVTGTSPMQQVSSSPLTPTQTIIGTIQSDNGPVPIIADSQTSGDLLNIAQVWRAGISHFVATYRNGTQAEVNANGQVIGTWAS